MNNNKKESSSDKAMSKAEIVNEISEVTNLKKEIVESVINAFIDIFIREVVMKGKFYLINCFSVKSHTRKARRQYNVNKKAYYDYPETEILDISLSKKVKSFFRWKKRNEYNVKNGLTSEDWKNHLKSKDQ